MLWRTLTNTRSVHATGLTSWRTHGWIRRTRNACSTTAARQSPSLVMWGTGRAYGGGQEQREGAQRSGMYDVLVLHVAGPRLATRVVQVGAPIDRELLSIRGVFCASLGWICLTTWRSVCGTARRRSVT